MRYLLIFAVVCILWGCEKSVDDTPLVEVPMRTVIAYLCGDNADLSGEVDQKIAAIEQAMRAMPHTDCNMIVYADYKNSSPRLLQIKSDQTRTIKMYTEQNSASAQILSTVLADIIDLFPAKSYGMICFSHGSGWLPQGALNNPAGYRSVNYNAMADRSMTIPAIDPATNQSTSTRTIITDNSSEMPIDEFARAIPTLPDGKRFDFVIFEACYMAGLEVAYELRDKTEHIVASAAEMLSPGFVDLYPHVLKQLFEPTPDLELFASDYFDFWNMKSGAWRSCTISLIRTVEMERLTRLIGEIVASNMDKVETIDVSTLQHFNRNVHHLFFDLDQFVGSIATTEQYARFVALLPKVVLFSRATPSFMQGYPNAFAIANHCGLTLYVPQVQFTQLNYDYMQMDISKVLFAK